MPVEVKFRYINHRGKEEQRKVSLEAIEFHQNPGYGYQPGWFVSGWDHDRQGRRSFALSRIVMKSWEGPPGTNRIFRLADL